MDFSRKMTPKWLQKILLRTALFLTFSLPFRRTCFWRHLGSFWHPFGSIWLVFGTLFWSIPNKCYIKASRSAALECHTYLNRKQLIFCSPSTQARSGTLPLAIRLIDPHGAFWRPTCVWGNESVFLTLAGLLFLLFEFESQCRTLRLSFLESYGHSGSTPRRKSRFLAPCLSMPIFASICVNFLATFWPPKAPKVHPKTNQNASRNLSQNDVKIIMENNKKIMKIP